MHTRVLAALSLLALSFLATPVDAQVVIGSADDGNCLPFGCAQTLNTPRVQHQYAASAFVGPIDITKLSFFCTNPSCIPTDGFGTASFTVVLSTSTRAMGNMSATADDNVGADAQAFFSGVLTGTYGTGFTLLGPAFSYDPANGNLLVDVFVGPGVSELNFLDAGFNADVDRLVARSAIVDVGFGLQIGINVDTGNYPGQTVVPEPATMALVSVGLIGIAVARRRRAESRSPSV